MKQEISNYYSNAWLDSISRLCSLWVNKSCLEERRLDYCPGRSDKREFVILIVERIRV